MIANLITHFTKEDTDDEELQEEEYENKLRIKRTVTPDDIHIINPIKEEDIQNEFISKPVIFDEDDAFETVVPLNVKQDIPNNIIQEIEDDFETLAQPIAPISRKQLMNASIPFVDCYLALQYQLFLFQESEQ